MKKNSSYKLICSSMRPSVYNGDSFSHVTERPYYLFHSHAASLPWKAIHFQAPHIILSHSECWLTMSTERKLLNEIQVENGLMGEKHWIEVKLEFSCESHKILINQPFSIAPAAALRWNWKFNLNGLSFRN